MRRTYSMIKKSPPKIVAQRPETVTAAPKNGAIMAGRKGPAMGYAMYLSLWSLSPPSLVD
jgi:hypothetical protein